jgi:hypothetical protein
LGKCAVPLEREAGNSREDYGGADGVPPIAMRNPLRFDQVPTNLIAGPTLDAPRPFPSWLHAGKKWGEQELIRSGVQPGFAQSDIKLTFSPASIRKMHVDRAELDRLQQAYKMAVDNWIAAIREEEALATPDYSIPAWSAGSKQASRSRMRGTKQRRRKKRT